MAGSEVRDWLAGLKLEQYHQQFLDQGFESLEEVADLTDAELQTIGVALPGHRSRILKNIPKTAEAAPPPRPPKKSVTIAEPEPASPPKPQMPKPAAKARPLSADEFGLNSVLGHLGDLVDGLDDELTHTDEVEGTPAPQMQAQEAVRETPETILSETVDADLDALLEDLCDFSFDIEPTVQTDAAESAAAAPPPRPPKQAPAATQELKPMNAPAVTELKPLNATPVVTELKPMNSAAPAPAVSRELKPMNATPAPASATKQLTPLNAAPTTTQLTPANAPASSSATLSPPKKPTPFASKLGATTSVKLKSAADIQARLKDYRNKLTSGQQGVSVSELDQLMKEEKIRIAMEKLAEASVLKLVLRIYRPEGTSKTLAVESTQTARDICAKLVLKHREKDEPNWALVEECPSLHLTRTLEDHESVGDLYNAWPPECDWKLVFRRETEKYALFSTPEKFLPKHLTDDLKDLSSRAERAKKILLQEFFSSTHRVPDLKGYLQEKDGGKKWKKRFFFLRSSGLYYSSKGESEASKDLVCFAKFDEVFCCTGVKMQAEVKAPTAFVLVFKPDVRKQYVTAKQLKYVCFADESEFHQWHAGVRLAKYGNQLRTNHEDTARKFDKLVKLGVASDTIPEVQVPKPKADSAAVQQWKASRADKRTPGKSAATGVTWDDSRDSIFEHPWYHGLIGREQTTSLFRARGFIDGCYLIRDSSTHVGDYVLSLCYKGTPHHFHIRTVKKKEGGKPAFQIDKGPELPSLGHIVKHYHNASKDIPTRLLAAVHRVDS